MMGGWMEGGGRERREEERDGWIGRWVDEWMDR